jgi:hypothetical protein
MHLFWLLALVVAPVAVAAVSEGFLTGLFATLIPLPTTEASVTAAAAPVVAGGS